MAKKKAKATTGRLSALPLRVLKQEVNREAGGLSGKVLKPKHAQPPPLPPSRWPPTGQSVRAWPGTVATTTPTPATGRSGTRPVGVRCAG
jgi:hypothetical protein